jgi:hypothetical protein
MQEEPPLIANLRVDPRSPGKREARKKARDEGRKGKAKETDRKRRDRKRSELTVTDGR